MSKCLVTTLKEPVSDSSLLHIDEVAIPYKNSTGQVNYIEVKTYNGNTGTIAIEGNGYFTDSTGTQNYGKTITINDSTNRTKLYIRSDECILHIRNKYDFSILDNGNHAMYKGLQINSDLVYGMDLYIFAAPYSGNIETLFNSSRITEAVLKYLSGGNKYGDISAVPSRMTTLCIYGGNEITGDLSSLASVEGLKYWRFENCPKLTGNINALNADDFVFVSIFGCPNINGNLNVFSGNTKVTDITLNGDGFTGNISSLAGCTSLRGINVSNTSIVGDTSSLANLTNLTTFTYANTAITGTWPLT